MSSCIVQFDNFQGQYYPGGNIVGKVVCSFTKSKDIREIRLKLRGKEHTSWRDTESYYDNERKQTLTREVEYYGDNTFLKVDTSLRGSGDVGPGRFEYPFNFLLPSNLPGSFNGKYGHIRYSIKATVDRSLQIDYEDMKEFVVVAPIDFNEIRDRLALNPIVYSDDKTICCCCCASGPITMNVHLDKEAYVIGETARIKVEITNLSNENVERVELKLGTSIESSVNFPSRRRKIDYELLAAYNDTGVGAHGERTYNFELEIPQSAIVPNFNACSLFKQWSNLNVKAVLPSMHGNMSISSRIIMGHIPIGGQREQFINSSLQQNGFYPPQQSNQFPPGGVTYPPTASPYPPSDPYKPPYPSGNNSAQFPSVHQPPYPPSVQPYPPNNQPPPYPPSSNPAPYPPNANPTPYPPVAPPPSSGSMGFAVPQSITTHPAEFPSLPPGAHPPMPQPDSAPYPTTKVASSQSGPSAPPVDDDKASAPSKAELAELGSDFVLVDGSAIEEDGHLLPSYNDAVHVPPYPPK